MLQRSGREPQRLILRGLLEELVQFAERGEFPLPAGKLLLQLVQLGSQLENALCERSFLGEPETPWLVQGAHGQIIVRRLSVFHWQQPDSHSLAWTAAIASVRGARLRRHVPHLPVRSSRLASA